MRLEAAVRPERQRVLRAAAQDQLRQRSAAHLRLFGQAEQVVRVVLLKLRRRAEVQEELHPAVVVRRAELRPVRAQRRDVRHRADGLRQNAEAVAARGKRADNGEFLRQREADLQRAVAAHREAGDEFSTALAGKVEIPRADLRHLLRDEVEVAESVLLVRVRAEVRRHHDDRKALFRDVPLDRRAPLPDRLVVARAVQQVQRRDRRIAFLLQAADADALRVFRQDDRQRRLHAQNGRKILEIHKCHFNHYSLFFMPVGEADCRFARRGKGAICKAHALSEHPVCHAVTAHPKRIR